MKLFKKILDNIVNVFSFLLICLVCGLVLLMLNELFLRNILDKSFRGMTELAGFMFLWIAFLGVAVLFDKNRLITLDILFTKFPQALQNKILYIHQIVAFGLGVVMVVAFIGLYPFVITEYYSSMPSFSKMWQFLPLAICGAFIAVKALYNIVAGVSK